MLSLNLKKESRFTKFLKWAHGDKYTSPSAYITDSCSLTTTVLLGLAKLSLILFLGSIIVSVVFVGVTSTLIVVLNYFIPNNLIVKFGMDEGAPVVVALLFIVAFFIALNWVHDSLRGWHYRRIISKLNDKPKPSKVITIIKAMYSSIRDKACIKINWL